MKTFIYQIILLFILNGVLALSFSCKEKDKRKEITRLITEWQGKEIVFPDNIIFTRHVSDTIDYQIPETDYKIICHRHSQ
jgi:hypothetical protein